MNRYLTAVERTFLEMGSAIVMNPVVMARCRGDVEPERLAVAVHAVQARHPALNVRVVRDDRPWFSDHRVPRAEVRCVDRVGPDTWRDEVVRGLNEPFDVTCGPLVRFVLVRGGGRCEILCITDHVNADGRSGLFVLRDVLRVLDDPTLRLVPLPDRDCFDARLPSPWWQPRAPTSLRDLVASRLRTRLAARGAASVTAPHDRPQIGVVERILVPEATDALVRRCRAEGVTIQAALMAACASSLATEKLPRARANIGCITPMDIRERLEPPVGDDFGIYAWAPTSVYRVSGRSELWTQARYARDVLRLYRRRAALASLRFAVDAMALTEGTRWADGYNRLLGRALDGLMVVSNLGRVELPAQAAGLTVESCGFYAVIPGVDFVLAVQSFAGRMELNFCYGGGQDVRAATERVADDVTARLEMAA